MVYGIPTGWLRVFVVTWSRRCRYVSTITVVPPYVQFTLSLSLFLSQSQNAFVPARSLINFYSVPFDRVVIYREAQQKMQSRFRWFFSRLQKHYFLFRFRFKSFLLGVRPLWQWFRRVWNDSHNLTGFRATNMQTLPHPSIYDFNRFFGSIFRDKCQP